MAGKVRAREYEKLAKVSWCPMDIKELKPRWNYQKRKDFLDRIDSKLQEGMVAEGWNIISYFIDQDPWV